MDVSDAGGFLVLVGGALFLLLLAASRATRGAALAVWGKLGLLRWVLIGIVVVVILDLSDGLPNG